MVLHHGESIYQLDPKVMSRLIADIVTVLERMDKRLVVTSELFLVLNVLFLNL